MNLDQLIEQLTRLRDLSPHGQNVVITTQSQGGIGAQAGVGVARVDPGFDWDQGRVLIRTDAPVITLTAAQVDAIQDSVRKGGSWHAYQAYKKQHEKIDDLRRQLAEQIDVSERACAIADDAMFEVLEHQGIRADEYGRLYGLQDFCGGVECKTLSEASEELRAAVEWLRDRGYIEVVDGADGVQTVVVIKEPT